MSNVIGVGIFITPQIIAQAVPHPIGFLAVWLAGGLLAFTGALAYAELGTMRPRSGGRCVYLREGYGPSRGVPDGLDVVRGRLRRRDCRRRPRRGRLPWPVRAGRPRRDAALHRSRCPSFPWSSPRARSWRSRPSSASRSFTSAASGPDASSRTRSPAVKVGALALFVAIGLGVRAGRAWRTSPRRRPPERSTCRWRSSS
ncbi:MAG: amino acid permease [Ignavibacteriales bacterium]|nr:amino acid permease [Ignavibacteriales bacterium]